MKCTGTFLLFFAICNRKWFARKAAPQAGFRFDLQLFNGEKTEEPTAKKKSKAKQKGQVAKSQEINSAFVVLAAFVALEKMGGSIYKDLKAFMVFSFTNLPDSLTVEGLLRLFLEIGYVLSKTALPIMLTIMAVALIINVYQVGLNFTTEPLSPNFGKLNPINGMKRFFSKRVLVELFKSIFKVVVIGYFIYDFLKDEMFYLPRLIFSDLSGTMELLASLIFSLAYQICKVLIVLGFMDFAYQKWDHKENMKMSKQEVKDESKQADLDPAIKSKIRQKQMAMAMQRMMQEVPKADVVVTNPTHYAVALKYEAGMTAPVVVAKGQDLVARRIKEIAKEAHVVIVENKPLARALYSTAEVGDLVPQELYQSVAEVLAYVYRLKKKLS